MRVLLVEDSRRLRTYVGKGLLQAGYAVDPVENGEDGLRMSLSGHHDVIILDPMLPGIDGIEVLQRLRESGRHTPVLILTAKDTVRDRVHGLEQGADDYLVKPFALEELLARVRALVRRKYDKRSVRITLGPLEIDTASRTATKHGRIMSLTPREYALMEYMALKQGEVVSRTEIEEHIYDDEADLMSNVVDSLVCRLRKKIESPGDSPLRRTRRGMGYVLECSAKP